MSGQFENASAFARDAKGFQDSEIAGPDSFGYLNSYNPGLSSTENNIEPSDVKKKKRIEGVETKALRKIER